MKKFILTFLLTIIFCGSGFADNYYFKGCKLSDVLSGDYIIDFEENVIKVTLVASNGTSQTLTDKIKLINEDKIISEMLPSGKGEDNYFQYYLDVDSESTIKQAYKKEKGSDIFRLQGSKKQSYCADVKSGWDMDEINQAETTKEEEQILLTRKKIKDEQSTIPDCHGAEINQWTNCRGEQKTNDGSKFVGLFVNGKIVDGIAKYSGGAEYFGKFKNNKPHAQGTFAYTDGSKYVGEWKDGKNHGDGIKTWKDGRKYSGKFKNDKPHGQGTFVYTDNSKYVGMWKDGKMHGQGTMTYPNGASFMGEFVAGLKRGIGVCMNQDGSNMDCKYLEDEDSGEGKNRQSIIIEAKKWVKLNEYETTSGKGKKILDQLERDFILRASELCVSTGNYNVLEKRIDVLEIDETPAFGTEPKIKIAINGVVDCI